MVYSGSNPDTGPIKTLIINQKKMNQPNTIKRVYHPTEFGRAHVYALELALQRLEQHPNQACIIELESQHELHGIQGFIQNNQSSLSVILTDCDQEIIIIKQENK